MPEDIHQVGNRRARFDGPVITALGVFIFKFYRGLSANLKYARRGGFQRHYDYQE